VVQGLLIHDAAVYKLYGDPPQDFEIDRETRPVVERIDVALTDTNYPLTAARPPFKRQVGTCRDFAAMLCAFARSFGFEARVRCGYSMYLDGVRPQDHWVVEHREDPLRAWRLADAQMDEAHRDALELDFDHTDIPRRQFITADEAWRLWRTNVSPADSFGHGTRRGERFVFVNLVRDALAQADVLRSTWDAWRELGDLGVSLSDEVKTIGDAICEGDRSQLGILVEAGPVAVLQNDGP